MTTTTIKTLLYRYIMSFSFALKFTRSPNLLNSTGVRHKKLWLVSQTTSFKLTYLLTLFFELHSAKPNFDYWVTILTTTTFSCVFSYPFLELSRVCLLFYHTHTNSFTHALSHNTHTRTRTHTHFWAFSHDKSSLLGGQPSQQRATAELHANAIKTKSRFKFRSGCQPTGGASVNDVMKANSNNLAGSLFLNLLCTWKVNIEAKKKLFSIEIFYCTEQEQYGSYKLLRLLMAWGKMITMAILEKKLGG